MPDKLYLLWLAKPRPHSLQCKRCNKHREQLYLGVQSNRQAARYRLRCERGRGCLQRCPDVEYIPRPGGLHTVATKERALRRNRPSIFQADANRRAGAVWGKRPPPDIAATALVPAVKRIPARIILQESAALEISLSKIHTAIHRPDLKHWQNSGDPSCAADFGISPLLLPLHCLPDHLLSARNQKPGAQITGQ